MAATPEPGTPEQMHAFAVAETKRWREITLPMSLGWVFFAGWAAWVAFNPQSWAHWGLVITSLYLTFAGIAQQIIPERAVKRVE